jgi:Na+/proline symporter
VLLLAIAAYLGAQFGIGVWASRRIRTEDDYLIAGRRLGYTLAIFSLLSHNLIVPLFGVTDQKVKVRLARLGVVAFGITAYILARHAEGVYELVEQASAFGGAGVLVTVSFGLFSRWGGPWTAYATLAVGALSYVVGEAAGFPYPFLASLVLSLGVYLTGAALE